MIGTAEIAMTEEWSAAADRDVTGLAGRGTVT
jgi:hypothetical protein